MVALKHSEGIKHTVLFQEQSLQQLKQKLNTTALFLSSVSLYSLHREYHKLSYLFIHEFKTR